MSDIYIILYSTFELAYCYNTYSDGVYYTSKGTAINHLENRGYKHICDDEYKRDYNQHAEILQLDKWSDGE